jgi:uncharacterized delta-60 repeat protein
MAFRYTPTPTPSISPTISLTPSITPTITPSSTSCPYVCCYNSGFTTTTAGLSNLFLADDNTILIGGGMSSGQYQGNSLAGRQILRIDVCGNFLQSYIAPGGLGVSSSAGGFAKQSDGKIIVAGNRSLWRLNADYTVDTTFTSGFTAVNRGILGVGVNSQDEILIVGNFSNLNYTTSAGTVSFNTNIYKLSKDGVPDTSYSGKSLTYADPAVEPFDNQIIKGFDGKLMVYGFEGVNGDTTYQGIVRFNDDFSLDTTFKAAGFSPTTFSGRNVWTSEPLANGQYLVGGAFQNYSGFTNQDFLIRLNNNGTLDTTFDFGNSITNQYVFDIQVQATGKIVVADAGSSVIRINSNGSVDTTFTSGTTSSTTVYNETVLLLLPNDNILVGGSFNTYNTLAYPKLVKLETDGALDMCPFPSATPTNTPTQTMTPTQMTPTPTTTLTPTPTLTPSSTPPPTCVIYEINNNTFFDVNWTALECDSESSTGGVVLAGEIGYTTCVQLGTLGFTGTPIISIDSYC